MNRFWLYLISTIGGIILLYFFISSFILFSSKKGLNYFSCRHYSVILSQEYVGVVEQKFVDYDNHAQKTIVLSQGGEKNIMHFFNSNITNLYELIEKGDSILKKPNASKVVILRKDTTIYSTIEFYCDSLLLDDTHVPFGGILY